LSILDIDEGGDRKHLNKESSYRRGKIGGGTDAGIEFGLLSSFTNISSSLSMTRGEYSTPCTMVLWW
jgi:hypothetical protein